MFNSFAGPPFDGAAQHNTVMMSHLETYFPVNIRIAARVDGSAKLVCLWIFIIEFAPRVSDFPPLAS